MRVMNVEEDIPRYFYIFIGQGKSLASQINYHNYCLAKRLISKGFEQKALIENDFETFQKGNIEYAPFIANPSVSLISSHSLAVTNGYAVEYELERYRHQYYPTYPSRFTSLYAFGDYASCEKASQYYGWDLKRVRKFKIHDFREDTPEIGEKLNRCTKVCKCNMEIVTHLWNTDMAFFEGSERDKIAEAYWSGGGPLATSLPDIETGNIVIKEAHVLYEYLIEGILEEMEERQ